MVHENKRKGFELVINIYESLLAMRDIDIYLGHQDKAQTYQNYAEKVKLV